MNRYQYANSNPLRYVDRRGESPTASIGIDQSTVGFLVGVGALIAVQQVAIQTISDAVESVIDRVFSRDRSSERSDAERIPTTLDRTDDRSGKILGVHFTNSAGWAAISESG